MILVIDNYDSFVHNLARYVRQLGEVTQVVRHDQLDVAEIRRLRPQALVLSPGPKGPQQAGICLEAVRSLHQEIPILGICLGHQVIVEAFGGEIVRSNEPTHGRSSSLIHEQKYVFRGLPSPCPVGRYHSLCALTGSLPSCLEPFGWLADGTLMAVAHRDWPVVGLQFHPESILTEQGSEMLRQFLQMAKAFHQDVAGAATRSAAGEGRGGSW